MFDFQIDWGETLLTAAIMLGVEAFVNNKIAAPQEIIMEVALLIGASVAAKYLIQYLSHDVQ